MKTVVLTNHVLSHFNEYCYRCMSCKISWPDRTQLLKHSQECPNSQVVRTKTKYKLKANCRLQLKFYLQTFSDYWLYEKVLEQKQVEQLKSNCKVYLNDIIINKDLLLDASGRYNLNLINYDDGRQMVLKDDDVDSGLVDTNILTEVDNLVEKSDVQMKDDQIEKGYY